MRRTNGNKLLKRVGVVVMSFLILLAILPYLIPLSLHDAMIAPYSNSGLFETGDSTIHYRMYIPEGEHVRGKVLLVHGLGGSTFSYEQNAPILAEEGFAVVTADLPGFGYSSRRTDENHAQAHRAELLWQLLDELDVDPVLQSVGDPGWHLGGHSMGGGTIAAMALQRQAQTASVIFIDGALFETSRNRQIVTFPVISRWLQVILERVLIQPRQIERFLTSAYGRAPTVEEVSGYLEPLTVEGTARSAIALLKTAKNRPSEDLRQLTVPAMAIWGEMDSWVPVSDTVRILTLMPQLQIDVIPEAAHCPMETHPEQFNELLLNWLQRFSPLPTE